MLTLFALSAGAATLSLSGECGGPVDIDVTGLTPAGTYAIFTSSTPGARTINGGPCPGITLGLDAPFDLRKVGTANGSGELHIAPTLPAPLACGLYMQVVDVASCTPSNVDRIGGADADGDGYYGAQDCDDGDPRVYPGAPEVCDGKRNDCDDAGWTDDDGMATWFGADGTTTDLTDTFNSGSPGAPADVRLDGGGELSVCPGHYYVEVRGFGLGTEALTLRGVGGSAVTRLTPTGGAFGGRVNLAQHVSLLVEGLTVEGPLTLAPDEANATLTDVVVPGAAHYVSFNANAGGPGTVVVDGLVAANLDMYLDDATHAVTVSNSLADRLQLRCGATGTDVALTDFAVARTGASIQGIDIQGCTATLERVILDDVEGGAGLQARLGAQVTATDLTVRRSAFRGIQVATLASDETTRFDGTRVTIEDADLSGLAIADADQAYGGNSEVTLTDSTVFNCGDVVGDVAALELADGSLHLIDTVVELGGGNDGGASLSGNAQLTCTKVDAPMAGFFSNSPYGARLRRSTTVTSNGCDWSNGVDVFLSDLFDPGAQELWNFGLDATFTCSINAQGIGSCS